MKITMGSVTTFFRYAPDGSRYLQQTTTSSGSAAVTKTVYYVGKYYERVDWSDGKTTEEHTYVGPSIAIYQSGSKRDVRYMHLDRLGSVEAVTSPLGAEVTGDAHSFDAFGKPRARDWQVQDKLHPKGDFGTTTEHGFTGHEHLDDTYLIHMNGRVYDYRLGRFLSVDPLIGTAASSQSINPYSYGGNNPFSGVDPTGYKYETQVRNGGLKTDCRMQSCTGVVQAGEGSKYTRADFGDKKASNGAPGQSSRPAAATSSSNEQSPTENAKGAKPSQTDHAPGAHSANGEGTKTDDSPTVIHHQWKDITKGLVKPSPFKERILDRSDESNPSGAAEEMQKLVIRTGERMRQASPGNESETYLYELSGGGHGAGIAQTLDHDTKVAAVMGQGMTLFMSVHNHTPGSAEGVMSLTDIFTSNKTGVDAAMYDVGNRLYYYRSGSLTDKEALNRARDTGDNGIKATQDNGPSVKELSAH